MTIACQLFARGGYADTSMNAIAEAAGVTKPVLYQHFGSKRELFLELLIDSRYRLAETFDAATSAATTARDQVHAGIAAYFGFMAQEEDRFALLFGAGSRHDPDFDREIQAIESVIADMVVELLGVSGRPLRVRETVAAALVGLVEGSSRQWLASADRLDPEVLAEEITALVWFGLRGLDTSQN